MLSPDEINKKSSNLSAFHTIVAISPPNARSNSVLECNFEELVLNVSANVFDKRCFLALQVLIFFLSDSYSCDNV